MSAATAAADSETASGTKNSPVFSYRSGNVRGSVFADELSRKDGNGSFSKYRASIQKFYKKKDSDDWAYTSNFDEDELFDVHLVAEELYKFIKADRATGSIGRLLVRLTRDTLPGRSVDGGQSVCSISNAAKSATLLKLSRRPTPRLST
jgi:hypothetical protein